MKKLLLLFGGNSKEHEVSYMSAQAVYKNIDKRKYKLDVCYLDKKNNFYTVENISNIKKISLIDNPFSYLKGYDLVLNIMHGATGEDGLIQGLLDFLGVKYIGPSTEGSVLGFNKLLSKIMFNEYDIPQVEYQVYNKDNVDFHKIKELGYPVIVKPVRGGSSIGISTAKNKKELQKALKEAFSCDKTIIIEKFIKGKELECSIIENKDIYVSTIGEISYDSDFYDYDTKYFSNKYKITIPAVIPPHVENKIKEYAKKAFMSINAKTLSRVDFLYDEENDKIYLNEINTIPGFTEISMYPKLLIHDKYTFKSLLNTIIKNSLY